MVQLAGCRYPQPHRYGRTLGIKNATPDTENSVADRTGRTPTIVATLPTQEQGTEKGLTARVGLVSFDFYPGYGGQGRHTYELWRHLRQAGVDVRVLSPGDNRLPGHTRGGALAARLGKGIGFSLYASAYIRLWRLRQDVDLLHVNGGPGGVLLGTNAGAPLVFTAHHTYAQQARMVPGQRWKMALARLEALGYRRATLVTADTQSTALSVTRELGVSAGRVTIVPTGFHPGIFHPTGSGRLDASVLFVGRLDARKGFEHLIRSWPAVLAARQDARLHVIGRGPLRAWADEFLSHAGALGSVTFLPRQDDSELAAWYNRVAVVAVPSLFEGFGLSALEAIACGTPVVATDSEGLRDVVRHGPDGELVPPGDTAAFSEALLRALAERQRIPEERLAEVNRDYAWPNVAGQFIDVYKRALAA